MRKLFMLLFVISLLTACENNPFSKKGSKEETTSKDEKEKDGDDDKGKKTRDDDDKDADESNWTNKQRNKWLDECIDESGNAPQARQICSCVLEKVEKKYPDIKDAEGISDKEGERLARECMADAGGGGNDGENAGNDDSDNDKGGGWTNLQRKQFVQGCAATARQAQGFTAKQANDYCDCMTRKVERKHTFQEAARLTAADFSTQEWQNAATDCRSGIED